MAAKPTIDELAQHFAGLTRFAAVNELAEVKALRPRFHYKFQGPRSKSIRGIIEGSSLWLGLDLTRLRGRIGT